MKTLHRLMFEYLTPEEYKNFCRVQNINRCTLSLDYTKTSEPEDVAEGLFTWFTWANAESPLAVANSDVNHGYWSDVHGRLESGDYPDFWDSSELRTMRCKPF